MGTHMKTTIEIADLLLRRARKVAAREGTTLRGLVEEGLRRVLAERGQPGPAFQLRRATYRGQGLRPEVAGGGWARLRELAYEERGG